MCEKCYVLTEIFKAADSDSHYNYIPSISFIRAMIKQDRLELYAGDCPLEEVEKHLWEEKHYTVCHYLRCTKCNQYFFIGACIRGTPIYKILGGLAEEKIDNILWGHYGTLFNKPKKNL